MGMGKNVKWGCKKREGSILHGFWFKCPECGFKNEIFKIDSVCDVLLCNRCKAQYWFVGRELERKSER